MKHPLFTLIPLLMILGNAAQAQDDVTGCSLFRIDQYYGLKEWDCRVPNSPVRISNVYTDPQGQQRVESVSSQQNAMCDDQGVCSNSGSFAGNAPAGSYHYTFGWYLGADTKGNPVSYKSGTGPGFGGKHTGALTNSPPDKSSQALPDVVCMPTASFNCSIDGKEIEDEDLPKYLPIVKEQDVKKAGGNCQSTPLCYDKKMILQGLNKKYFKALSIRPQKMWPIRPFISSKTVHTDQPQLLT
ncbi:hypothetical protein BOH74_18590 [Pseudomonas versuta]|uniref:Uncharacterized protein n=1 Tax=Pseudomonas versuta TaxID=1788301 RepID=A0A853ZQG6_9PSED|nr:hypothetical protein [Pseudomonas versuta]OKA19197.1 hypothetical protein BOH74_18590 [Pseudomonas versuta]